MEVWISKSDLTDPVRILVYESYHILIIISIKLQCITLIDNGIARIVHLEKRLVSFLQLLDELLCQWVQGWNSLSAWRPFHNIYILTTSSTLSTSIQTLSSTISALHGNLLMICFIFLRAPALFDAFRTSIGSPHRRWVEDVAHKKAAVPEDQDPSEAEFELNPRNPTSLEFGSTEQLTSIWVFIFT